MKFLLTVVVFATVWVSAWAVDMQENRFQESVEWTIRIMDFSDLTCQEGDYTLEEKTTKKTKWAIRAKHCVHEFYAAENKTKTVGVWCCWCGLSIWRYRNHGPHEFPNEGGAVYFDHDH